MAAEDNAEDRRCARIRPYDSQFRRNTGRALSSTRARPVVRKAAGALLGIGPRILAAEDNAEDRRC